MNPFSRRQFVRTALAAGAALDFNEIRSADNIIHHGATGDGRADDTDAMQHAVDSGRGLVYLPRGTYRLTRTVVIDLAARSNTSIIGDGTARIIMAGAGPAFHFIGTHSGSADPLTMSEQIWDRERLPVIQGFEIRGDHDESVGILLEGTVQANLTGLLIRRCRIGIHLVKRNRNPIISHCHIYHNRSIGIDFDHVNLHQAIIADNHISYNAHAGIRLLGGNMRNFQIVGNDIEYNHDFKTEGSADVLIDMTPVRSSFREGTIVGNTIQAKPSPAGANIRFVGGPHPDSGGMFAITGNFVSHQTDNIHLDRCRMVTITGNAICSATDRTMRIERCTAVTISGNTIDWNPNHRAKDMVDGIAIRHSKGIVLADMIIENCLNGSAETGGAVEVDDCEDVTIANCQILDPRHRGIVLSNVIRGRIHGCSVVDRRETPTMKTSIEIKGSSRQNLISNNMVNTGSLAVPDTSAILQANVECSPSSIH